MKFLDWRPALHLLGETSGKNAIVVTAAADLDQAVVDVVHSAFGHAGQKCSAASLVIVEGSVLRDGRFARKLADATRTLVVGPAGDVATDVPPLIRPASGPLHQALNSRGPWLVAPERRGSQLWSPGILAEADDWFVHTECFGPVLGMVEAADLDDAIRLQNSTGFGLTGGLHSLDPGEIRHWLARVEVGNAYVNRPITGAVVRRQPFGGWKRSAVGPTAKTGGPGYVPALCRWTDKSDGAKGDGVGASYDDAWARLQAGADPSGLRSEINLTRCVPLRSVAFWIGEDAFSGDEEMCRRAAAAVGVPITGATKAGATTQAATAQAVDRVRVLGTPTEEILRQAHAAGITVDTARPVADGDIEVRHWIREQSVSITAHRHGRPLRRDDLLP
jgi:RHH-type proline utilization regulon transcriptional repressor/proline dehydrogenase/delta 1-pyrroline-5-carboxylate dehydrogenase